MADNKCLTALLVTTSIIITAAIILLVGVFLVSFPYIIRPDQMTTAPPKISSDFATTTPVDLDPVTKGAKQEINQMIEKIKARGYETQEIFHDMMLDLKAQKRGEDFENAGPRKLDPLSLQELRQYLSQIRLDDNPGSLGFKIRNSLDISSFEDSDINQVRTTRRRKRVNGQSKIKENSPILKSFTENTNLLESSD